MKDLQVPKVLNDPNPIELHKSALGIRLFRPQFRKVKIRFVGNSNESKPLSDDTLVIKLMISRLGDALKH